MAYRTLIINLAKLVLCGLIFSVGTILGGLLASLLKLPAPTPPQGADLSAIALYSMLATPLLALALALIARGLGGTFLTRTVSISFFTWTAYTLNTQLEASIFSAYAAGFRFAIVDYLVPALLCGAAISFLFPPEEKTESFIAMSKAFFAQRAPLAWAWRLAVAAVAFMPIYFVFGLMVVPFTGEYYRQNLFGLTMPTIDQILPILFIRSVLFLVACLPIIILWRKSRVSLFLRLGFALYVLVGLIYMLISTWLPLYVRLPHALEILADEFVYAGVLVMLLTKRSAPE